MNNAIGLVKLSQFSKYGNDCRIGHRPTLLAGIVLEGVAFMTRPYCEAVVVASPLCYGNQVACYRCLFVHTLSCGLIEIDQVAPLVVNMGPNEDYFAFAHV